MEQVNMDSARSGQTTATAQRQRDHKARLASKSASLQQQAEMN